MMARPLSFLQINLQHCRNAQDLLWQTVAARSVDLVIASEQYNVEEVQGWYIDHTGWAAIGVCPDCSFAPGNVERGEGYVAVQFPRFTLYSCYFSPNSTLQEFEDYLLALDESISRRPEQKCIVAGDFNAKSEEWRSGRTDHKGYALGEWVASRGLETVNVGTTPTRFHQGFGSRIDVTFAHEYLARRITNWEVLDKESGSDHRYIHFTLRLKVEVAAPNKLGKWAVRKLNKDRLQTSYLTLTWGKEEEDKEDEATEDVVNEMIATVTAACDSAMPRCGPPKKRRAVYWWTEEIAQLRQESNRQRRLYQRCRGREEARGMAKQYQQARKRLKSAIKASKREAWRELCDMADEDPFGKPYKVVMKKLGGPSATSRMEPGVVEDIMDVLFPQHPPPMVTLPEIREDVPLLSTEEVDKAVERLKGKYWKAPEPDEIPNPVWSAIHEAAPSLLVDVFNKAMVEGTYPTRWRRARLALIEKKDKPPGRPSSYRPLCLLDNCGKLFERTIVTRLEKHLERRRVISRSQYGFRTGRSTADAALQLKKIASAAMKKRQFCAAVGIDISNAFNSIPWQRNIEALMNAKVPVYLLRIISSYLSDRMIEAETSAGTVKRSVTCGVPQGSVLGPTLWNVAFNDLLKVELPPGVQLICYADDTLVVGCADTIEEVESRVNQALDAVTRWIESAKLQLAVEKTEAILFTNRRKFKPPTFRLRGVEIKVASTLKYLGIWFDGKLSFREHFRKVAEKATRVVGRLSRLMSNLGGPKEARRRMMLSAATSVLLYGAPVWADSARVAYRRAEVEKVQRRAALRCVSAYRTVSTDALFVLAQTPPLELIAEEREAVYKAMKRTRTDREILRVKRDCRQSLLSKWKEKLDQSKHGRWTCVLIQDLGKWMNRKHGQLNFHLTQVMSGHGCFNEYLFKMGKVASPVCSHCTQGRNDDAQHTLFKCDAWRRERSELERSLREIGVDEELTSSSLVPIMLKSEEAWNQVSAFASTVMKKKMNAEWSRQMQSHAMASSTPMYHPHNTSDEDSSG
jgi:hypothetical protein